MTKNKLAKLAAKSGSSNTTMDVTSVPAQLDLSAQFYVPSADELNNFNTMPWALPAVGDSNYDYSSDPAGTWTGTEMLPIPPQTSREQQTVVEQHRQEGLDHDFTMSNLVDFSKMETAEGFELGDECMPVAADFDPYQVIDPAQSMYSFGDGF